MLLAAAGGGFVFGAVRAGAGIAPSSEAVRENRADESPAVADGADTAAEAADGSAGPGAVALDGPTVEAEGIAFDLPAGWEPLESLPEDMSMTRNGPETVYALTRTDGTIVAYASVTLSAANNVQLDSVDTANAYRVLLGRFNEWDEDAAEPYEVPGSPDATRLDLRFSASLDGSMLVVDTGALNFTVLSLIVNESSASTEDEVTTADLDAILASVSVP
ncbi:hypothetical protein [Nocardiopsis sp. FIRDI 009]|uniref:hypothetical protein n=1 Tax=Nocardiopsis sp. FIRDI 009 TaxID=714197 RepID=UPI000E2564F0|nr:hypothetical protein [Nocardiopsis sp. FIRDI 009]